MAKFNSRSTGTKTTNHEGAVAYKSSAEYTLAALALTSFVEGKFYESANSQIGRLIELSAQVSGDFLARLAVYARREANMRSVSHVLIGELARLHKGRKLDILAAFVRPDDMSETLAYYGHRYGKPIPNQLKKAIALKLQSLDAYALGKYKMETRDVKMVDLFNLVHPKPKDDAQAKMWKDLLGGNLKAPDTWEVQISTAKDTVEAKQRWEALIAENKLGYMALLRNLRNFDKYDLSPDIMQMVADRIKNPELVKKSRQLPFRFLSAYKHAPNTLFKDSVSYALDAAVDNMPKYDGKTAVFVDVSGSMRMNGISNKSQMTCAEIALMFGLALWKGNPHDTDFYTFDTNLYKSNISSRTPLIDLVNSIPVQGGGTYTHLTFDYLTQEKIHMDQVFILSDNEGYGGNVNASLERYKREVNPNVKVYAIDLQGYGHMQFPQNNVYHIAGWSEKIFDVIKTMQKGGLVNTIKNYEIPAQR